MHNTSMHEYANIYIYILIMYICVNLCVQIHIYMYLDVYSHTHIYRHMHTHILIHICLCVYIYIHTRIARHAFISFQNTKIQEKGSLTSVFHVARQQYPTWHARLKTSWLALSSGKLPGMQGGDSLGKRWVCEGTVG